MPFRNFFVALFSLVTITAGFCQNAEIASDMKKLVNYKKMVPKHYTTYTLQRTSQFDSWKKNQIPSNFRIPATLQSYRDDYSLKYYVIYNPAYKIGVGYVPSNLALYYEEEAWAAYQKFGNDAPSLSIVLAQQFTESAFNPQAIGDNNMSVGLPQLYLKTAKYLYKTDKQTWKEYFYFDKRGKQHFKSTRAMVKFPFVFLPTVKNYQFETRFESIKSYNGTGDEAIKYAEKVMRRSLFYEELFAQNNPIPLDTTHFKENLFGIINLSLLSRDESPIDETLMDKIFANALAEFHSGYIPKTYVEHYQIPVFENLPTIANQEEEFMIPVDGKDYYLIVEDGQVIYNYFPSSEELFSVISHPKNSDYYLYYLDKKKRIKVTNLKKVGNRQVYSNIKPGDKIFIPPGTFLKSPKTNLAIMIQ